MIGPPRKPKKSKRERAKERIAYDLDRAIRRSTAWPAIDYEPGYDNALILDLICEGARVIALTRAGVHVAAIRAGNGHPDRGNDGEPRVVVVLDPLPDDATPAERSERDLAILSGESAYCTMSGNLLNRRTSFAEAETKVRAMVARLVLQHGKENLQEVLDRSTALAKRFKLQAWQIATATALACGPDGASLQGADLDELLVHLKVTPLKVRPFVALDQKLVRNQKTRLIDRARTIEITFDAPQAIPSDDVHIALKTLRHQHTNYDRLVSTFQGQPGRDQATRVLHDRVNKKIVERFPQLKPAARLAART